ncbi:MAG: transcriptional repressor NrdR [SAR202 cluster bacterium]|uniref:ATP-cone domain-containing protein n=1 Tax=marine metagenome TaxID=408172 RepID=A0A381TZH0_9ZZZZ|nr:transcriptional repressor NrdR [SAR202 cluster bacterium]
MHCPFCGQPHSKVTDSRVVESGIRRRRECQSCELRFTTYERAQAAPLMVSKQDNRREEFSREKLISGIRKACTKRPVPSRTLDKMVEDIEAVLQHLGNAEVSTTVLGTMVMERLRELDRVAYIRYASVYRAFQDIESFEEAVWALRDDAQLPLMDMPPVLPKKGRWRAVEPEAEVRPAQRKSPGKNEADKKNTGGRGTGSPQQGLMNQG